MWVQLPPRLPLWLATNRKVVCTNNNIAMNAERQLIKDFESKGFEFDYCDMCDTVMFRCPKCKHGSCSGGGCDYCSKDEWERFKASTIYRMTKTQFNELMFSMI